MARERFTVVTHGGAGSDPAHADGTAHAAQSALDRLRDGADVLEAVVHAVELLEDDERFNAGTGSNLRADGRTIEMDASCMTDDGRFGAVAALGAVRHPVRVARAVMDTPYLLLCGEGALRFARSLGAPEHDPFTDNARRAFERHAAHKDTVGAVATDGTRFAAALSSGGTPAALVGRVGDVPLPGCGLHAGPAGAVACTGHGEAIARRLLAHRCGAWLEEGSSPARVVDDALALFPEREDVGLIVVSRDGHAGGSNRWMAWSVASG